MTLREEPLRLLLYFPYYIHYGIRCIMVVKHMEKMSGAIRRHVEEHVFVYVYICVYGGGCREVLIILIKCILSILSVIIAFASRACHQVQKQDHFRKKYRRQKNMNVITTSDVLISHTDSQMGGECPELTSGNEY